MAALSASRAGGRVVLLEKNPRLGRKLLLTGNGRCNLTNAADLDTLVANMPGNGAFLYHAFSQFGPPELRAFLAGLGVETVVEEDGRVFPANGGASEVLAALERALTRAGVVQRTGDRVESLAADGGRIHGVRARSGFLPARAVVVATGGLSYPATGSSGDGYEFAVSLGHRLVTPLPSLVPLTTVESWPAELQGLSLGRVRAVLSSGRERAVIGEGELLFTHYGVSGPVVFGLSRQAAGMLADGRVPRLVVDLRPDADAEMLADELDSALAEHAKRSAAHIKLGTLPVRLRAILLSLAGIPADKRAAAITRAERMRLCALQKALSLTVSGTRPLAEAYVTAGGVCVREISPRTMASRLVEGLYFAGEVLDVDGNTGGFNLQAAFSTGKLAGEAAAAYPGNE